MCASFTGKLPPLPAWPNHNQGCLPFCSIYLFMYCFLLLHPQSNLKYEVTLQGFSKIIINSLDLHWLKIKERVIWYNCSESSLGCHSSFFSKVLIPCCCFYLKLIYNVVKYLFYILWLFPPPPHTKRYSFLTENISSSFLFPPFFPFILFIPSLKQFIQSQERNHNQFKTAKPMGQIWPISCFIDTLSLTSSFAPLFTHCLWLFSY